MAIKTLKDGTPLPQKRVYETGHGKNVANFSTFLNVVLTMADKYKPANPLIATKALDAKEAQIKKRMEILMQRNREA